MKNFNVIAVSGRLLATMTHGLVPHEVFRSYMEPLALTCNVDEKQDKVHYNGKVFDFVGYGRGIHGYATTVRFKFYGDVMELYTDTPAFEDPSVTSETIRAAMERRKARPVSGY